MEFADDKAYSTGISERKSLFCNHSIKLTFAAENKKVLSATAITPQPPFSLSQVDSLARIMRLTLENTSNQRQQYHALQMTNGVD